MKGEISDRSKYKKGWTGGGTETPCGYGSRMDQTAVQREWLPAMVEKYKIKTIADIGAGDLNWVRHVTWPAGTEYQAYDLIPRANEIIEFDLLYQVPPAADLILCLWVLNHMPPAQARQSLQNLRESGAKYLAYTWWPAMREFLDLGQIESAIMRTGWSGTKKIEYEIRIVELQTGAA